MNCAELLEPILLCISTINMECTFDISVVLNRLDFEQ